MAELPIIYSFQTVYKTSGITYRLLDKSDDVELFLGTLEKCERFAFDCESIKLGRNNKVSVINICLEDGSIFLIDVQEIGGIPSRLKSVLERDDIKKVMFDCRSDSDALLHQHQVMLHGIEDMQIMRYILQNPGMYSGAKLPAFSWCVGFYLSQSKKSHLQNAMVGDYSAWGRRPLTERLLGYASYEISMFFPLREKIMRQCPIGLQEIHTMSERCANKRRNDLHFTLGRHNGFMSIGVLQG